MTYEVQQTRYDRLIRRVTGSIGPGSRVSESISELFPMIDVESRVPELLLLAGTRLAFGFANSPSVAGNFSAAMLRNPGGSGTIITLHELTFTLVTQAIAAGTTLNTLSQLGVTSFADTRAGVATPTVGQVLFDAQLVAAPDRYRLRALTGSQIVYHPPNGIAVLGPGSAFGVSGLVLNSGGTFGFKWSERATESSELNL